MNSSRKQNVPEGWVCGTLGDFIDQIGDGGTPSRAKAEYFGGDIPWVVVGDIKKKISNSKDTITSLGLEKSSAKLWPVGTVILSFGATIGEVGVTQVPVTTKQGIAGIIPKDLVSNWYLYYLLLDSKNRLKNLSSGSTIREARPNVIKKQVYACIPESEKEQKKITEVLDAVDGEIEKTKEVITAIEKLKKGLMQKLFTRGIGHKKFKQTELGEIPENWQMDELGNSANFIDYRGKTPKKTDSGIPLITAKNVRQGYVSHDPREFIAESDYDLWMTRGIPQKGDVLFTTEAPLGYVAQIDTDKKIALAQRIITMQSLVYNRTFLKYLLSAPSIQNRILGLGTGGTVKGIKASVLKKLSLPVPKITEQKKIAEILSAVDEKISVNKKLLAKQTELKKGLMQDLLSGNKRVNV